MSGPWRNGDQLAVGLRACSILLCRNEALPGVPAPMGLLALPLLGGVMLSLGSSTENGNATLNWEKSRRGSHPRHVLLVLADDVGWNNLGWHAQANAAKAEVSTPTLDALVAEGVELERAIAFKYLVRSICLLFFTIILQACRFDQHWSVRAGTVRRPAARCRRVATRSMSTSTMTCSATTQAFHCR